MKLAPLLAEYLFQNKRLDLPGIGTFYFDSISTTSKETGQQIKPLSNDAIRFEATSVKENPELINFISSRTGKIKALAAADLDSHLELAHQFLNIGNPFLFEGIGSMVKTSSGLYEFVNENTSDETLTAGRKGIKEYHGKEIKVTSTTEDSFTEYENILYPKKFKINHKSPAILLLLFAGIGLAIGGGYLVYKMKVSKNNYVAIPEKKEQPISIADNDTSFLKKAASVADIKPNNPSGHYKFVVEVAGKKRGLYRYKMLRELGIDAQLETRDSTRFKIFFLLPAMAKDTTRMRDSLRNEYTPSWSRAYVEN